MSPSSSSDPSSVTDFTSHRSPAHPSVRLPYTVTCTSISRFNRIPTRTCYTNTCLVVGCKAKLGTSWSPPQYLTFAESGPRASMPYRSTRTDGLEATTHFQIAQCRPRSRDLPIQAAQLQCHLTLASHARIKDVRHHRCRQKDSTIVIPHRIPTQNKYLTLRSHAGLAQYKGVIF